MVPPFLALNQYSRLTEPCVRDLAWTLCSKNELPVKVKKYRRAELVVNEQATTQWLAELNTNPQPLQNYLANHNVRRLGKYFESLLAFFFLYGPSSNYQLEQHNYILRGENNSKTSTLGELDFVLSQGEQLTHLEVAVKFYLGIEVEGKKHWLGPNAKDSLERKLSHLQTHQLPMGKQYPRNVESKHYIQGYLFEHYTHSTTKNEQPKNNLYLWCFQHELHDFFANMPLNWKVLDRSQWLGGLHEHDNKIDSAPTKLDADLLSLMDQKELNKAKMLNAQTVSANEKKLDARLMVVNNNWPNSG